MNKQLFFDIFLFIIPLILLWFVRNELSVALGLMFLLFLTFSIKYEKNEIYLFLIGVVCGIVAEVGGDYFNQIQYWENGLFFGVPLWLPILWGYGVVYFRRLGNYIVKK
ncbi:MAG: hypothetical protein AB7V77_03520 [Candidatus Woesearchaeota archaeon]